MKSFYLEFKNKNQVDGECIAYSEKVDGLSEDAIHVVEYEAFKRGQEMTNIYQIGMVEEFKYKNGILQKRIKELEELLELSQKMTLGTDDCYYWTPEAWKEFKELKAYSKAQQELLITIQKILEENKSGEQ